VSTTNNPYESPQSPGASADHRPLRRAAMRLGLLGLGGFIVGAALVVWGVQFTVAALEEFRYSGGHYVSDAEMAANAGQAKLCFIAGFTALALSIIAAIVGGILAFRARKTVEPDGQDSLPGTRVQGSELRVQR
jgi:hypothetical protein